MQERLERFRKVFKEGIATRGELKAANKKLFGKESSPSFITKNKAFKTDVPGLYRESPDFPWKVAALA